MYVNLNEINLCRLNLKTVVGNDTNAFDIHTLFREAIVMSSHCEHCELSNNEKLPASTINGRMYIRAHLEAESHLSYLVCPTPVR